MAAQQEVDRIGQSRFCGALASWYRYGACIWDATISSHAGSEKRW